jgi:hypothetical protein
MAYLNEEKAASKRRIGDPISRIEDGVLVLIDLGELFVGQEK